MKLTPQQTRFLTDRLNEIRTLKVRESYQSSVEPEEVQLARKIVKDWDIKQSEISKIRTKKLNDAVAKIRQVILFGEPDKALAALEAFDETQF